MRRLFGTDGVRGKAGEYPLDPHTIRRIGAALVRALPDAGDAPRVLIGRDTRESGPWIEQELALGARATGASVVGVGIMPTPAVAFLTKSLDVDVGVVISASHNAYEDNGIKVFSGRGEKLTEQLEARIEASVADPSWALPPGDAPPVQDTDLAEPYLAHLRKILPPSPRLDGLGLVVDCANGATSMLAPRLLAELGFAVTPIGCAPDGRNINRGCGSTHPDLLVGTVSTSGQRLGAAFDGDGDRALLVDRRGHLVDGDAVLFICAKQFQREGRLRDNAIVATVMSNVGLELALRPLGIEVVRCPVGDKYVMEEMLKRRLSLGGEQSGHIIIADDLFTGDGLGTLLNVLRVMAVTGRELADLAGELVRYPQVLVNVSVQEKVDLTDVPELSAAIQQIEKRLGGQGRLLVRYSGTEPLLRVMIEGRDHAQITSWAQEIAAKARQCLG